MATAIIGKSIGDIIRIGQIGGVGLGLDTQSNNIND